MTKCSRNTVNIFDYGGTLVLDLFIKVMIILIVIIYGNKRKRLERKCGKFEVFIVR
jgi:hypothetical protein